MGAPLMDRVSFDDRTRFEFAEAIAVPLGAIADRDAMTIEVDSALAKLLSRVSSETTSVLPIRDLASDRWLIVGTIQRDLDVTLSAVSRFVVPTYAEHASGVPTLQTFDLTLGGVEQKGAAAYSAGYYVLHSPSTYFTRVLERLSMWAALESHRPKLQSERFLGYRDLLVAFNSALSAGRWDAAESQLAEIRQRGLATADNMAFLEVQSLAQQRRWADLWRRTDFSDIARLRAPRAVRAALLAAFHQSELLPLEQLGRWSEALDTFKRTRSRFGSLLEGPSDITYAPALLVFAYREAAVRDSAALNRLIEQAPDNNTRLSLEALAALLPPPEPTNVPIITNVEPLPPQHLLRNALADGAYTTAWVAAEAITNPTERTAALLEVAFFSDDLTQTEAALLQLWSLAESDRVALLQYRHLALISDALDKFVTPESANDTIEPLLTNWLLWLDAAINDPDDRRLLSALDKLTEDDERYWTTDRIRILSERLTHLAMGDSITRPYLRDAISRLRNYFLQDTEFPRLDTAYADLYEALYLVTLEQHQVNEHTSLALLRLAEARLRQTPQLSLNVSNHLRKWLDQPMPILGDIALEILDLLAAYGIQGSAIAVWYRGWAETILAAPRLPDRATLLNWLAFGEWVQPGDDLLQLLRKHLTEDQEEDPLTELPSGYAIGIFTLRPQSAERVAELLRQRNSTIQVRICSDIVLSDQARALARSADMSVIVTTCISHALTYGIGPYLRTEPVYPQASGSTSILRAIEKQLQQTFLNTPGNR